MTSLQACGKVHCALVLKSGCREHFYMQHNSDIYALFIVIMSHGSKSVYYCLLVRLCCLYVYTDIPDEIDFGCHSFVIIFHCEFVLMLFCIFLIFNISCQMSYKS